MSPRFTILSIEISNQKENVEALKRAQADIKFYCSRPYRFSSFNQKDFCTSRSMVYNAYNVLV